jgi:hypothetical protein
MEGSNHTGAGGAYKSAAVDILKNERRLMSSGKELQGVSGRETAMLCQHILVHLIANKAVCARRIMQPNFVLPRQPDTQTDCSSLMCMVTKSCHTDSSEFANRITLAAIFGTFSLSRCSTYLPVVPPV